MYTSKIRLHSSADFRYYMTTASNGNIFHVTGHLYGEFTVHRWIPRTKASDVDVFFDLRLNKLLSKQSWGWGFETPSRPLWRHCNVCTERSCSTNRHNNISFSVAKNFKIISSLHNTFLINPLWGRVFGCLLFYSMSTAKIKHWWTLNSKHAMVAFPN